MAGNQNINIHFSPEFVQLGIKSIAYALLYNINNQIPLPPQLTDLIQITQKQALACTDIEKHPVINGYREMIKNQRRSLKKFPPSAQALLNIIHHSQSFPYINPVVDIYNVTTVETMLSIGAHDLDKIDLDIYFRLSEGEEKFCPIGGSEKTTQKGDYVYADKHNILAWLDTRDSEKVKISPQTTDIILFIQGNLYTSLEYRLHALETLCSRITHYCGGNAQIHSILVG